MEFLNHIFIFGVGFFVLAVVAFLVIVFAAGQVGEKLPETGVRIWEGKPGSGKSYGVMAYVLRSVLGRRRPVYTNLPIRLRPLRAYLRAKRGSMALEYVQPLGEEHFRAFLSRFAQLAAHCEEAVSRGEERQQAELAWIEENGPHVPRACDRDLWRRIVGRDGIDRAGADSLFDALLPAGGERLRPNWIPYGSVIVIDELHKWFDQRDQRGEIKELLDTLTMHRHGLYQVEVLTQNAMQVSQSIRRQTTQLVRAIDLRELPVFFGINVPIPMFRYQAYTVTCDADLNDRDRRDPARVWMEVPWLSGGLMWRLYDSFTHVGSLRGLKKRIERTREDHEGDHYDPKREEKVGKALQARRWLVGKIVKTSLVVGLAFLAYRSGRQVADKKLEKLQAYGEKSEKQSATVSDLEKRLDAMKEALASAAAEGLARKSDDAAAANADPSAGRAARAELDRQGAALQALADEPARRVGGIGDGWVMVDGGMYGPGDSLGVWFVSAVDARRGTANMIGPQGNRTVRPGDWLGRRDEAKTGVKTATKTAAKPARKLGGLFPSSWSGGK